LGGLSQGQDRGVGAEEQDAPAVRAQEQAEGEQGDVVSFPSGAGEYGEPSVASAPESGEGEQPSANEVTGEMLLTDRFVAPVLPVEADLGERRQDHLARKPLEPERREALVQHGLGGGFVVALDRLHQPRFPGRLASVG
jgi:hypothetical protein